jgi:hypothetical protein
MSAPGRQPESGHSLPRPGIGGRLAAMNNALREELFKLTVAERLELG